MIRMGLLCFFGLVVAVAAAGAAGKKGWLWGEGRPPMPQIAAVKERAAIPAKPAAPKPKPRPAAAQGWGKTPLARRARSSSGRILSARFRRFYRKQHHVRALIEVDKPLYKPGETIWVRVVEVGVKKGRVPGVEQRAYIRLLSPKGQAVQVRMVRVKQGHSAATFALSRWQKGGSYTLQYLNVMSRARARKSLVVQRYTSQRIRKSLRFLRRGLGPGSLVLAQLKLHRSKGALPVAVAFEVSYRLQGKEIKKWRQKTEPSGEALISFRLPKGLKAREGQLILKLSRGGVVESLVRRLPLLSKTLEVGFFPEGGQAVVGGPSRVYFSARSGGQPVDIEGVVQDEGGQVVARVRSFHHGMGRFAYAPKAGKTYRLKVLRPEGASPSSFVLPAAKAGGVALQAYDDFSSSRRSIHLQVYSTKAQKIVALATQRQQVVGRSTWSLRRGTQRIQVPVPKAWRGIVRVTLFALADQKPLAERLLFRHPGRGLEIQLRIEKQIYRPRARVEVEIQVKDPSGKPVKGAHLGASVVDDGLLRQADSHAPHWLSQFHFASLPGKVFRPNFYFSKDPKARRGLDLVMGTYGWRRFRWEKLKKPPKARKNYDAKKLHAAWKARYKKTKKAPAPLLPQITGRDWRRAFPPRGFGQTVKALYRKAVGKDRDRDGIPDAHDKCPDIPGPRRRQGCPKMLLVVMSKRRIRILEKIYFRANKPTLYKRSYPVLQQVASVLKTVPRLKISIEGHTDNRGNRRYNVKLSLRRAEVVKRFLVAQGIAPSRMKVKGYGPDRPLTTNRTAEGRAKNRRVEFRILASSFAPPKPKPWWLAVNAVRRFPVLFSKTTRSQTRLDRRKTVYWAPHLQTDGRGVARIAFGLSDRISAFRLRVSGVGAGVLGRGEATLQVEKALYLTARWPKTLSMNDALALPVTLHNFTKGSRSILFVAKASQGLGLEGPVPKRIALKAGERATLFVPIRVKVRNGRGHVSLSIRSGRWRDGLQKWLPIRTFGVPRKIAYSGLLKPNSDRSFRLELPKDFQNNGIAGRLFAYPNLVGQIIESAKGLVREPNGCFEQTSSSNFPNAMLLQLLRQFPGQDPRLVARVVGYLYKGSKRLRKFWTSTGGFSMYGRGRGSLWLTAYGIWQFSEMKRVVSFPSWRISRAVRWLRKHRKPAGNYVSSTYWSRISSQLKINAYIAFALAQAGLSRQLKAELGYLHKQLAAASSLDPYLLALALNAMAQAWGTKHPKVRGWAQKLLAMRSSSGSFLGTKTVVGSYGQSAQIQTTALAILALQRAGISWKQLTPSVHWLQRFFRGGHFGSTQATVLVLKALGAYNRSLKYALQQKGKWVLSLNQQKLAAQSFQRGRRRPVTSKGWLSRLRPGTNRLQVSLKSSWPLPFELSVTHFTRLPKRSPQAPLGLKLRLSKNKVKIGAVVRLHVELSNRSSRSQWLPMVRLQLPAGLEPLRRQLEAMQKQGSIELYETEGRKLYLYLRKIKARKVRKIEVDCVAQVTGNFVGNASSAYGYYNSYLKTWAAPLAIQIGAK